MCRCAAPSAYSDYVYTYVCQRVAVGQQLIGAFSGTESNNRSVLSYENGIWYLALTSFFV